MDGTNVLPEPNNGNHHIIWPLTISAMRLMSTHVTFSQSATR